MGLWDRLTGGSQGDPDRAGQQPSGVCIGCGGKVNRDGNCSNPDCWNSIGRRHDGGTQR